MSKVFNARIENASLGYEDHGILTIMIHLKFDNGGQGFGGYNLSNYASLGMFIQKTLDAVGVNTWEKLSKQYVRIRVEDDIIVSIGNIVEDRWFEPRKDLG